MYWNVSITYRHSLWLHFFSIWIFYKHLKESNHTPLIILIQFHHLWCLLHYETTPYLFPDHMSQPFLLYTNRQQDCTSSVFTKDRRTSRGFVCFFSENVPLPDHMSLLSFCTQTISRIALPVSLRKKVAPIAPFLLWQVLILQQH